MFAFLPETKNKKPEEMANYFKNKKNLFAFRKSSNADDLTNQNDDLEKNGS